MHIDHQQPSEIKGVLAWIERTGNRLPDPVFIFFYCIAAVVLTSVILAAIGVSAIHPTQVDELGNAIIISAESLLSAGCTAIYAVTLRTAILHHAAGNPKFRPSR